MTVRLEELLAAAAEREWSSSPVAWETSLRSRIPFNAEAAALIAEWIALAPDAVRLLIDTGEELRKWSEWAERIQWVELDGGEVWDGGFASAATTALLARLDRLGNDPEPDGQADSKDSA